MGEIPEVVGAQRAEDYVYLPILDGPDGTHHVNLNEMGTTGHDKFSVTKSCKNPALLLKWIDQVYEYAGNLRTDRVLLEG